MSDPTARALSQPWAERAQQDTTPSDYQLTELARILHPGARWWWGVQKGHRGTYATCYLCGIVMDAWPSWSFVPERSRSLILDHRQREIVRRLITQAVHAPGGSGRDGDTGRSTP